MSDALARTNGIFYGDTGMDPKRVQETVDRELADCDEGELYLEKTIAESYSLSGKKAKVRAGSKINEGFGIRYSFGESVAFRPSSDFTEKSILQEAKTVRMIRGQAPGTIAVAKNAVILPDSKATLYMQDDPLLGFSPRQKVKLLRTINAYVRGRDPRVEDVQVSLLAEYKCVQIIRPFAPPVADIRPMVRLNVGVVLKDGIRKEMGGTGMGGRFDYSRLFNEATWRDVADEALRQASILMIAKPAPAGTMTVVVGPGWTGVLLHEAVGHGLEGDFNRKGSSAFSGRVGEQVASPGVTVVDDGTIPDCRGSLNMDDEGTPTQRTVLIENGILRGYMQDRQNARLMGAPVTGNGRRQDFSCPPMPRMTNTFAESGEYTPKEIVATVKKGLYAPNFGGGSVDITSGKFNFQMSEAYIILDGKVQWDQPVKGALLIGNGPDIMKRIGMVGNDSKLDPGIGTCGKNGQGVPAGVGQPTMRIDGITVGGPGGPL